MKLCLEDICQEIKMYGNIWTLTFSRYSKWISKESWFYSVLEYNYKNNIRINIDHASLSPQREFDKSIMEIASQLYDNSLSLTSINIVPMAHGFHDLSSICTASGKALFKPYLCSSTINIPCNNDIWPVKHHVRPKDYTI